MRPKKKKRKTKKVALSACLRRKDVKAQIKAAENRGYIRGYDAHKNNFGE